MITLDQLQQFTGHGSDDLVAAINATIVKFNIDSPRRVRYFLAQSAFESGNFTKFVENLNYSTASRLVAVWPSRFTMNQEDDTRAFAPDYVSNPEKLANLVYANRNGNGDVASGDGFAFRGRGGFGLTGKDNYAKYSQDTYGDDRIVQTPDMVADFPDAMLSAGWFWSTRDLNPLADADEFTRVTTVINGSSATAPERLTVLNKANLIF